MTATTLRRGQRNDDKRWKFAAWLIDPDRQPRTQQEWAKQNRIAESTCSEWRKHPDVIAIAKGWRDVYASRFFEVMDAAFTKARKGDVSAMRFVADVLGMNAPTKSEVLLEELSVRYAEPTALRDYAQGVLAEAKKQQEARRDN